MAVAEAGYRGMMAGRRRVVPGLTNKLLVAIPPKIFTLRGLLRLKLAGNNFSGAALPEALCAIATLQELDLSRCRIAALPNGIGSLSALTELSASENELTQLPPSIGKLRALVKLALFKNKLASLPDEIGQCSALEEVSARGGLRRRCANRRARHRKAATDSHFQPCARC